MKRADLTTELILDAVADAGLNAWEQLTAHYPPKLVLAAIEREVAAGRLDYGASPRRPFLNTKVHR